jgi:hypothetical protein
MIESRSESSLPLPLKIRGARGVMKLDQGFAEGKRMVPGPGKSSVKCSARALASCKIRSTTLKGRTTDQGKGQPDNEAGLKLGFTEEKCFQCLKPGVVDPGRE